MTSHAVSVVLSVGIGIALRSSFSGASTLEMFGPQSAKCVRVDHVGRELVAGRDQLQHDAAERAQHVLGRFHAVLDRGLAHHHDEAARRIAERAARGAGVALRAGPDLLLHRVVDALEILRPEQLDDLARAEIVVMRRRAGRGADAAIQAAVQLVIEAQIGLDVREDRLELLARNLRASPRTGRR